jgi:hypothetical protein
MDGRSIGRKLGGCIGMRSVWASVGVRAEYLRLAWGLTQAVKRRCGGKVVGVEVRCVLVRRLRVRMWFTASG